MFEAVENVVTFKIAFGGHVIVCGKKGGVLPTQCRGHLVPRPDIEFALFAFGVGVE
jgi:hypothetical protein